MKLNFLTNKPSRSEKRARMIHSRVCTAQKHWPEKRKRPLHQFGKLKHNQLTSGESLSNDPQAVGSVNRLSELSAGGRWCTAGGGGNSGGGNGGRGTLSAWGSYGLNDVQGWLLG